MFNPDFYPTPEHIIHTMINGENLTGKVVLEPSAGKGNIVDVLKALGAEVLSCEKNSDLARIVAQKSKFIASDFMTVTAEQISHINAIYMNPPFTADEKHIMHAWEIAPDGCEIVALCNMNTLSNKYTRIRTILGKIIEGNGYAMNLGDVFSDAERRTGVDIGLVRLIKPVQGNDFFGYFESENDEVEEQYNGIMPYNAIRDAVQRYVEACRLYDEVAEHAIKMNNIAGVFGPSKIVFTCTESEKETKIQDFKTELKKLAWSWVFNKMNMEKYMTENLKKELNKFVEMQKEVPFTMKNIYKMLEMVVGTNSQRMDRVLIEVFDKLTMRHHENRYCLEGWKTNSHYMVNKKFIIEGVAECNILTSGKASVRYGGRVETIEDLTKALSFITGNREPIESLYTFFCSKQRIITNEHGKEVLYKDELNRTERIYKEWGTWYEWGFFKVKIYKKGTLHAQFLDLKVWEQFNRAVAKAKGYELPENVR